MDIVADLKSAIVTVYANMREKQGMQMSLFDCLRKCKNDDKIKADTFAYRQLTNQDARCKFKQDCFCATISGCFAPDGRKSENLLKHSGYICIDIDHIKPQVLDAVFDYVNALEISAYVGRSISGNGLFAIIKLAYPDRHGEQFDALQEYFNSLPLFQHLGLTLDTKCRDIPRLRVLAHNATSKVNADAVPFTGLPKPKRSEYRSTYHRYSGADETLKAVDYCVRQIEARRIDLTADRDEWIKLGYALRNLGQEGRDYYHRISRFYDDGRYRYSRSETNKVYNSLSVPKTQIDYFLTQCEKLGIVYNPELDN